MSDSAKLISVLALIPVLIFSIFGFFATFEPAAFEEVVTGGRVVQRVICAAVAMCSLGLMARLAAHRCPDPLVRD